MSGLILAVGAAGKFTGNVIPALVAHGATVRGLVHEAAMLRDSWWSYGTAFFRLAMPGGTSPPRSRTPDSPSLSPTCGATPTATSRRAWRATTPVRWRRKPAPCAFLGWFYEGNHVINHDAFPPEVVDEYLRTFAGNEGVLGSLGVYRAAFASIAQTEPLLRSKITTPVWAMGGEKGLGAGVGQMVALVAEAVQTSVEPTSGHFLPEEAPAQVAQAIIQMASGPTFN